MELLKHELYKIFTRKSIYFAIVILLILYSLPFLDSRPVSLKQDWNKTAQTYLEWEGPVTQEKLEFAEKVREQEFVEYEENIHGPRDLNLYTVAVDIINTNQRLINWNERMNGLRTEIVELRKLNSESFEYKEKVMAYEAFKKVGPPEIYYNTAWSNIVDFVNSYGLIFIGALILLGLSPVFSEEYSGGTDNFILAAKKGKSSIITAKILASFIYVVTLIIFLSSINLMVNMYRFGLGGWDTPLRNLSQYGSTPYVLDIWQYYLYQIGIHTAGAMAFALVVLAISAMSRSALVPFFTGGLIFGVPVLLTSIFKVEIPWVLKIVEFSHTEFIKVAGFFKHFKAFNVLGFPIIYLNLALVVFTIVSLAVTYLIFNRFRNHQIS